MRDLFLKMEKRLLALLLCVVMVLGCLAGCRTNKGGSDNGVNNEVGNEDQDNNNGEMGDVEIGGDEDSNEDEGTNENEEASGENDDQSDESENEGTDEGTGDSENGDSSTGNEETNGDNEGDNEEGSSGDESGEGEIEVEIVGSGTSDDPYSILPDVFDDKLSVTTFNIPAGGSEYYAIQRIGGMILVLESADAYIVDSEGNRYDPVNGVITFEVQGAMASEFVVLEIGNASAADATFTLEFFNKEGTYGNPTKVSSLLNNSYQIHIEAGNSVGHYYKYYAEKDGVIRFSIESITDGIDGGISVTNNRNSANRTLGADGDGTYVEIEVQAGDELMIIISVLPDRRGKYKEADITWHAEYAE